MTYVRRERGCDEFIDGTNRATLAFGELGDQAVRLLTLLLLAVNPPLKALASGANIGRIFLTILTNRASIVYAKCTDLVFVYDGHADVKR